MKKSLLVVLVFLLFTGLVFAAGLSIGPSVLNSSGATLQQYVDDPSSAEFDPEDLFYGVEARADFSLFQVSTNAYVAADGIILAFVNAGVNIDLGPIGLGLTAGPNFLIVENAEDAIEFGSNIKLAADLNLGGATVTGFFAGYVPDLEAFVEEPEFMNLYGWAGVSVLLNL